MKAWDLKMQKFLYEFFSKKLVDIVVNHSKKHPSEPSIAKGKTTPNPPQAPTAIATES